jgi:hypothetical protein
MGVILKSDVKNNLSAPTGARALPVQPAIHADATGYSEDDSKDVSRDAASSHAVHVSGTGRFEPLRRIRESLGHE